MWDGGRHQTGVAPQGLAMAAKDIDPPHQNAMSRPWHLMAWGSSGAPWPDDVANKKSWALEGSRSRAVQAISSAGSSCSCPTMVQSDGSIGIANLRGNAKPLDLSDLMIAEEARIARSWASMALARYVGSRPRLTPP